MQQLLNKGSHLDGFQPPLRRGYLSPDPTRTSVGANRPIVRYSLVWSAQTDSYKELGCVE
jgi:hypothetical protein